MNQSVGSNGQSPAEIIPGPPLAYLRVCQKLQIRGFFFPVSF